MFGFVVGIVGVMIFACLYVSRKAEDDEEERRRNESDR